jgi:tetratricopeptide (TPR) repeat protein
MPENSLRLDVSAVSAEIQRLTTAIASAPLNAQLHIKRGMALFQLGNVSDAIAAFDQAERLNPGLTPYLWQRGIAYYYAERYADGVRQFETDLTVNGHDVEETVWRYLCQAQAEGADAARQALLPVRGDSRPIMSWVYRLFAGTCQPEDLLARYGNGGRHERFYGALYLGLYFEAGRSPQQARERITLAADMQVTEDFMGWVAIVHRCLRGWAAA